MLVACIGLGSEMSSLCMGRSCRSFAANVFFVLIDLYNLYLPGMMSPLDRFSP